MSEETDRVKILLEVSNDKNIIMPLSDATNKLLEVFGSASLATKFLVKVLDYPNPDIQKLVTQCIGKIGDSSAVPALVAELEKQDNFDVSLSLIDTLGDIGDETAIPSLVSISDREIKMVENKATTEPRKWLSSPVLWALLKIGVRVGGEEIIEPAIRALQGPQNYTACLVLRTLGDDRAIKPLLEVFINENENIDTRKKAGRALGNLKATEPLFELLKSPDSFLSRFAMVALGIAKNQNVLKKFLSELQDSNVEIRRKAANFLSLYKPDDPIAFDPLFSTLADLDAEVRYYSALALGELGDKRALDKLLKLQKDKSWFIDWSGEKSWVKDAAIGAYEAIRYQSPQKPVI